MRIIFMGTPEFAVHSLDAINKKGYNIVAVITSVDKYGGRGGKKLIESDVKKYAINKGLKILQPKNLKAPEFVQELKELNADLQIVVAFRMLPEVVWNMPRLGTYNLHGSLLPKYRGAAPIHWAVINGETETGVTSFKLKHKIDTGDILIQKKMGIGENETTGSVHDRMMFLAAEALIETLERIEKDDLNFIVQDDSLASKAPKIFREDCEIEFNQNAFDIHNFIRGMSPFPGAWTNLEDKELKIFSSRYQIREHKFPVGSFLSDNKKYLKIACNDGFIELLEVKLAGKKKMDIKSFLNGYDLSENVSEI